MRCWFGCCRIAPEVDLDVVDRTRPLQEAADLDSMDFLNLMAALLNAVAEFTADTEAQTPPKVKF